MYTTNSRATTKRSKNKSIGNSLAVQYTFTAEGLVSIPGLGTKIPQAAQLGQKILIIINFLKKYN